MDKDFGQFIDWKKAVHGNAKDGYKEGDHNNIHSVHPNGTREYSTFHSAKNPASKERFKNHTIGVDTEIHDADEAIDTAQRLKQNKYQKVKIENRPQKGTNQPKFGVTAFGKSAGEFVDWGKSQDANFVELEVEKIEKAKQGFSAVTAVKDASRTAFKDVNMKPRVIQDKKAKSKQTFRNAKYKKFDE